MIKYSNKQIKDICSFIGGSQPPKSEFIHSPKEGYVRLIQIRDRLNDKFITYIPEKSTTKFCEYDDILIGRYGPPIFQIFRGFKGAYNVAIMKAEPINNVDKDYLYYFLLQPDILKYVESMSARTAGQTGVELDSLYEYPVNLPNKITQKKIASVLKSIDDKISNNNRINSELESMAKTIYDYWFTQFDFPDENGKPYKSSGGKMVWNEKLKREIPEGWGATTIGSILGDYPKTTSILRDDYGLGSKYPIIDQSKDYICGYTDDYDNVLHMNDAIVYGDHTNYTKYVNFDFARGADGTQIINSNEPALPNYILYQQILLLPVIEKGYSRHFKFLKEQYVIVPEFEVSKKYMDMVEYSLLKTKGIITENQQLASLRDWLLPMLMNGQVGFEGVE